MHRIVCLLVGLFWAACLPAQSFLDSYQAVVRLAQEKRIAEALAICESLLPEAEAFLGAQSLNLANFYNSLAGFYSQTQNDSAAFAFYTKVAHIRGQQLGLLHPERLKTLNKMANALFRQGRYPQAEALYWQLIEQVAPYQESLGPFYYNAWSNLGFLYFQQKQWEKADSAYQKAQAGYQELTQADTAEWLLHTERQARLYQEQSRNEAASERYRQIITIQTRFYGPQHPYTRHSQFQLARLQNDATTYLETLSFSLSEEDTLQRRVRQELLLRYLEQKQTRPADSLLSLETGQAWGSTPEGYRLQAQLAWQQGRLPQANQFYEQACQQLRPALPVLFAQLQAGWEWGQLHFEQKNYALAARIWENMLALMPSHLPAEKEGQAWQTALFNLAQACYLIPDYTRAQQNFERLLSMPSLPPLLEAYTHLGLGHVGLARQDYAGARRWLEQGQQKWKKYRPDSEDTLLVRFWEAEAEMYQKQGEWNEARRIFEHLGQFTAATPAEKAFWFCREAEMYYQQGQLGRAEARYQVAVQLLGSIPNPAAPDLIPLLNNLGTLHKNQSRYAEAATLYQMAEECYARASPPKSLSLLLSTWQNQSRLQRSQARYREAAQIIARGLEQAQAQQNDYWQAAFALEEAHLLRQTGQPAAAEAKYYALEAYFLEKGYRADYFEVLRQRFNILLQTGRHQKAIEVLQPLLEMSPDSLNEGQTLLADLSVPLARAYVQTGQTEQAEAMLRKIIALRRRNKGEKHPDFATALDQLGQFYLREGQSQKARSLLEEAALIRQETLPASHPAQAISRTHRALLAEAEGKPAEAERWYQESLAILEQSKGEKHPLYGQALNNLALFYENQKQPAKAAPWFQEAAQLMAEYGRHNLPGLNESEQLAFWQQNRTVIDNFLLFVARYAALPEFQALLGPALQLRLQTKGALLRVNAEQGQRRKSSPNLALDSLYQRWRKNRQCLAYLAQESVNAASQGALDSLIKATDQLEKQMALRQFRPLIAETPAAENWQTLQTALQAGEAALEMTRLTDAQGQVYYWALLVVKDVAQPLSVLIKDGQALEKNHWHFYTNNIQFKIKDTQSFDRYWQPIQALLDQHQVKRLYFSPDGVYHLLNPLALYESTQQDYLANRLDLVHLSNLQALLRQEGDNAQPQGAVLVGGLEYGPASAGEGFKPLPGTQIEIENIAALFQKYQNARPTLWQGKEAGKTALLNLQNPGLLHLATHGFFYSPPAIVGESLASEIVSPLLRAGLALSGANQGEAGFRDGLLSAYEVSEMQLEETELVVLSACQTGMGQVENGEGVYGLQRAFHLAGAKQVLVSLWAVNDQVGQQWMQHFYENYLQTHRADLALRHARSQVQTAFAAPYYWAGFVLWEK